MIRLILQVFCAIFSGCLEALSISNEILPAGSPLLALFCLVPLYIAIYKSKSYREAFWIMIFQTLTVHLISSSWLANFHDFAIFTLGASAFGTCLMGGCCGVVMYILPSTAAKSNKLEETGGRNLFASPLRMIWFACTFLFWEWIKSTGFLAYPWGTLPMAAYKWKIITQISSLTGVWGITFLFALFSAFIGESTFFCINAYGSPVPKKLLETWRTEGKALLILFAVTAAYGLVEYYMPRTPSKTINTVIIQQNADPWEETSDSVAISMKLTEEAVKKLKKDGNVPDLVLWSEGVLDRSFPDAADRYYMTHPAEESLSAFINRMNVPFVMGGKVTLNKYRHRYGNAAVLYDKSGTYAGFYCKMHLVPFAERLPYPDNPIVRQFIKFLVGFSYGWTPGNQYVLFETPVLSLRQSETPLDYRTKPFQLLSLDRNGYTDSETSSYFKKGDIPNPETSVRFTTPICFEDAFTDVCRPLYNSGSEVFMNITNDSWSETASAEYQHFIAASYLALEFRTTLVRCANAGYSVVVDPSGRIIDDIPLFQEAYLCTEVPVYDRVQTVYSRYGDWFAYMCIAFIVLYALSVLWSLWISDANFKPDCITVTVSRREDAIVTEFNDDEDDFAKDYAPVPEIKSPSEIKAAVLPEETVSSAEKKTSPAKNSATSAKKTAASVKKTPSAVKKPVSSAKKAEPPARKTSDSAKKTELSAKKTVSTVKKAPAAAKKTSTAAKKPSASAKKAASPAKKAPAPQKKASVSAKKTAVRNKK